MLERPFTSALALLLSLSIPALAADAQRQAQVRRLGAEVMPFDLSATTHIFTKTPDGGVQRVVAKQAGDATQVALVRQHLKDIQSQFLQGDFSGPAHIHGMQMPGLGELKAARPGQIAIDYREVPAGAELRYRTADATLVTALHQWFDAQLADHGADAQPGHDHDMHHPMQMDMDMPHMTAPASAAQ